MVEWVACYGNAKEQPSRFIGAKQWFTSSADVFFEDPPKTVKTESGGATRVVLSGFAQEEPEKVLGMLDSDTERQKVALVHAKWDYEKSKYKQRWRELSVIMGTVNSALSD